MNKRKLLTLFSGIAFVLVLAIIGRQIVIELNSMHRQSIVWGRIAELMTVGYDGNGTARQSLESLQTSLIELDGESKSLIPFYPRSSDIEALIADNQSRSARNATISFTQWDESTSKNVEFRILLLLSLILAFACAPIVFFACVALLKDRSKYAQTKSTASNINEPERREELCSPLLLAIKASGDSLAARLGHEFVLELQGDDQLTVIDPNYSLIESAISELVRNAIEHGGRSPVERESLSKPIKLKVFVSIEVQDGHTKIIVADDGEGIDEDVVISHAIEKGVLSESEAQNLKKGQGVSLILLEGYSDSPRAKTSRKESACLFDIYRHLQALKGELSLRNRPGAFTEFTLHIPN